MTQLVTLTLFVRDFDASIDFYCKWLGFTLSYNWNKLGHERIVRLKNDHYGIQLSLQSPRSDWEKELVGKQSGSSPCFTLQVKNLQQHYKNLQQAGAPLKGELAQPPYGDFAYLSDPDGNEIGLVEYWEDLEQLEIIQENLNDFKKAVYQHFSYLIHDYAYELIEADDADSFTVKYSNGRNSISINGIHYGSEIAVHIKCDEFRKAFSIHDLIEVRAPQFVYPKIGQEAQITAFAKILRDIGTDILQNDFTIVPQAIQKSKERQRKLEEKEDERIKQLLANNGAIVAFENLNTEFTMEFDDLKKLEELSEPPLGGKVKQVIRTYQEYTDYERSLKSNSEG